MARQTRHPACEAGLIPSGRSRHFSWLAWAVVCGALVAAAGGGGGCSGTQSTGGSGATETPLLWGADAEGGAPYLFVDPNDPDRQIGFEVDLVEELAKRIGRPIQFQPYSFGSLTEGLERGDFDFAMNGLEDTPDRRRSVRLSRPYYVYRLQLAVRADDQRIAGLDDCKRLNLVVGTLGNTAASRLLESRGIEVKTYEGQIDPYKDLESKRLDAVLMDVPIAAEQLKDWPALRAVGQPFAMGFYVIAFDRSREDLARRFDSALQAMAGDGALERIYKKWELWNNDQLRLADAEPTLDPDPALASGGGVAAGGKPGGGGQAPEAERAYSASFRGYFPKLLSGAISTILLSLASMLIAMILGLFIALSRMYGPAWLRWMAISYIEFFRGVPVLLMLYTLYFGPNALAKSLNLEVSLAPPAWLVAITVFGLTYAAFEAEIYRAGLAAIPIGQWEAAASLGMSKFTTLRRIILPQTFRIIMPPVTNDFVAMLKDTSLVSTISMTELTKEQLTISRSYGNYLETGAVAAVLYLLMSVPLGYLARKLEKRWNQGG